MRYTVAGWIFQKERQPIGEKGRGVWHVDRYEARRETTQVGRVPQELNGLSL